MSRHAVAVVLGLCVALLMTVWGCKDKKETEGPSVSADELCKTYAKHLEGCEPNPEMGQDLCDPPSEAECREEITSIQEGCKNGESVLKCMVDSKELMGLARCRDDCKMSEAGASGVAKAVKAEAVDMLDKIYIDALVHDRDALEFIVDLMGAEP